MPLSLLSQLLRRILVLWPAVCCHLLFLDSFSSDWESNLWTACFCKILQRPSLLITTRLFLYVKRLMLFTNHKHLLRNFHLWNIFCGHCSSRVDRDRITSLLFWGQVRSMGWRDIEESLKINKNFKKKFWELGPRSRNRIVSNALLYSNPAVSCRRPRKRIVSASTTEYTMPVSSWPQNTHGFFERIGLSHHDPLGVMNLSLGYHQLELQKLIKYFSAIICVFDI